MDFVLPPNPLTFHNRRSSMRIEIYRCDECGKILSNDELFIEYKDKYHFCDSKCMEKHLIKIKHVKKVKGGRCDWCGVHNGPRLKFEKEYLCNNSMCLHSQLVYRKICKNCIPSL
jgi:hypothetical protein